jgi:phosphate transport system permease protein
MTVVETPPPADPDDPNADPAAWILQRAVSPRRRFVNGLADAWMIGSLLVALVPVVIIAVYVASKGAGQISLGFLTKNLPVVTQFPGGGIAPAIVGTLVITGVAALMAIPLGVLAAIYLNEYGRQRRIAKVIRFMADVMTGVPSIVMGLFVATIWVSAGLHFGYSGFAGSLALAALMLPIVIRSCEEMLKLVPGDLRQASDALGARRWRTVTSVVIPAALPGIVSGAMLAVARAAGETAPLLFTIGVTSTIQPNVFHGTNTTLSQEIWFNAQTPFEAAKARAWGAALTLIVIVFVLTVVARIVSSRFASQKR